MAPSLPDLSRFEMQCLRRISALGEATVREIRENLPDPPSYSTVRKIIERLEEKGAVRRTRLEGKAWVYRPAVSHPALVRKEIRRFVDSLFDGSAAPLVAHLADMRALTASDLREIESQLRATKSSGHAPASSRRAARKSRRQPGGGS